MENEQDDSYEDIEITLEFKECKVNKNAINANLNEWIKSVPDKLYRELDECAAENTLNGGIWLAGLSQNRLFNTDIRRMDVEEARAESDVLLPNGGIGHISNTWLSDTGCISFSAEPLVIEPDKIYIQFDAKEFYKAIVDFSVSLDLNKKQSLTLINPNKFRDLFKFIDTGCRDLGEKLGVSDEHLKRYRQYKDPVDPMVRKYFTDYLALFKMLEEEQQKCHAKFNQPILRHRAIEYKDNYCSDPQQNVMARAPNKSFNFRDDKEYRFNAHFAIDFGGEGNGYLHHYIKHIKLNFKKELIEHYMRKYSQK